MHSGCRLVDITFDAPDNFIFSKYASLAVEEFRIEPSGLQDDLVFLIVTADAAKTLAVGAWLNVGLKVLDTRVQFFLCSRRVGHRLE